MSYLSWAGYEHAVGELLRKADKAPAPEILQQDAYELLERFVREVAAASELRGAYETDAAALLPLLDDERIWPE